MTKDLRSIVKAGCRTFSVGIFLSFTLLFYIDFTFFVCYTAYGGIWEMKYRHVILIGIDGAGNFYRNTSDKTNRKKYT